MVNVSIIGAGLAGLSAAYVLSQDKRFQVTIVEQRDRVGGRVHTVPINGQMVDLGGFIIYSWYKEYHRLLNELGLAQQLRKIPLHDVYYQIDHSDKYYTEKQLPFSKKDTAKLALKMAKPILEASDVAAPPLDNFGQQTGSAYLRSVLHRPDHAGLYETWSDVVSQGYCYPPVDQFKMSFIAPFIRRTHFGEDVAKWYYLPSGAARLPLALADAITRAGHSIQLNTTVTDKTKLSADYVVYAQTASCSYTQYYTVTVRSYTATNVPHDPAWGAVFYLPNHQPLQITSAVNLGVLYGPALSGYVNLNIVVRDPAAQLSNFALPGEIVHIQDWPQTMPCADEHLVQAIRDQQGQAGRYYAGDWLGAPSMETALLTGRRAAERIIKHLV
ncbi:MAG: hypothetical protein ACD_41C00071G0002 [uncultured bacterium]|nr:MAG: hypothetical protein ACD_41C00071G0002 [uncultured bacterium]